MINFKELSYIFLNEVNNSKSDEDRLREMLERIYKQGFIDGHNALTLETKGK